MRPFLVEQFAAHPSMTPRDAVKLCFQAAFGAEHSLEDLEGARRYFDDEFQSTPASDAPLYERISEDAIRVNLSAWKARGLRGEWLFRLFARSARIRTDPKKAQAAFIASVKATEVIARNGEAPFTLASWLLYRTAYETGGVRAVHHSEAYRQAEKPAYRVVRAQYARIFPVLEALARTESAAPHVIAIDGRAGAGKSTAAEALADALSAQVVHMDDFFLPLELRTDERAREVGGNVHYERFAREVLPHLKSGEAFSYRRFDCESLSYDPPREIPASDWYIVEGAYSCHPAFGEYMRTRVFADVDAQDQIKRIRKRNGAEMERLFASRWIPLEEAYLSAERVRERADVVI